MPPFAPREDTPSGGRTRPGLRTGVPLACVATLLLSGLVPALALQSGGTLPKPSGAGAADARDAASVDAGAPGGVLPDRSGVPLLPLLPPLWVTGETHAHVQLCNDPEPMSLELLLARQQATERQVTFAQLWGLGETIPSFLATWAPLVTGSEHAVSEHDPDYIIQYGIEVSKFPADQFGHVHGLGISDAMLPLNAHYPRPILEACRAQHGAITGYAHVYWPEGYVLAPVDPFYGGIGFLAPTDTALGLVDFVEAVFEGFDLPGFDWRGMYYKLLNAGLRPALTAGSDNTCALEPFDELMAARIESAPLTVGKWTSAIKAGRTTVAEGPRFLDLQVEGVGIGGSVLLDAPGPVTAEVRLTTAEEYAGQLRIIHDGRPAPGPQAYSIPAGGTLVLPFTVQVDESGWIAGEAKGADGSDAHSGAIYVIVEDQPIAKALDAAHFVDFSEELLDNLDTFDFASQAEQDAVAQHIRDGRSVFEALLAGALPLPAGVTRYGASTPACDGPIQINVRDVPTVGNPRFAITNVHAPAHATGWLVMGLASAPYGIPVVGIELYIDPGAYVLHAVVANSGGYHEFGVPLPPALQGATLYWQYLWQAADDCGLPPGGIAASDAIAVTVQ